MATDDVVNKLKKLTEMTRRDFLRGTSATAAPKIPGQGLQSLIKGIPLNLEDLYRQQTRLKKLIVEYLGSSVIGEMDKPGGFGGIKDTLNSPEAKEAGRKYFNLIMNQYRKLTDTMEAQTNPNTKTRMSVFSPVEIIGGAKERKPKNFYEDITEIERDVEPRNIKQPIHSYPLGRARRAVHVEAGLGNIGEVGRPVNKELLDEAVTRAEREVTAPKSLTRASKAPAGWSETAPPEIVDRPTNFKTWHEIEKEVRDDLQKQEKTTGRTLITRSARPGRTIPIGSPLPVPVGTVPKPKPKKLEGRPDEPKRTTKPKEPERKPQPQKPSTSPRITRTASPPPQLPSGKDLSRIALRGAATLAGWPLYAASFGIPSARSGESQVLSELADQPGADVDAALRNYRQRLAQEQQELDLRGELVMSGMP
jgi:hypothetical protein